MNQKTNPNPTPIINTNTNPNSKLNLNPKYTTPKKLGPTAQLGPVSADLFSTHSNSPPATLNPFVCNLYDLFAA